LNGLKTKPDWQFLQRKRGARISIANGFDSNHCQEGFICGGNKQTSLFVCETDWQSSRFNRVIFAKSIENAPAPTDRFGSVKTDTELRSGSLASTGGSQTGTGK